MAFREVVDLGTDSTTALGGINTKTGKTNPTSLEGYYLGKRELEDIKKKSGKSYLYIFKTADGNTGVWGKTDLDRKMTQVSAGVMTLIEYTGKKKIPGKNDMYTYKVSFDPENRIDVSQELGSTTQDDGVNYDEDVNELEEAVAPAPTKPSVAAKTPSAAAQNHVRSLLNGKARTNA